jgi:hypothetical protein
MVDVDILLSTNSVLENKARKAGYMIHYGRYSLWLTRNTIWYGIRYGIMSLKVSNKYPKWFKGLNLSKAGLFTRGRPLTDLFQTSCRP